MKQKDKLNVLIIFNDPYPYGMAVTNRIHLYARGLIEGGHAAKIIVPRPREKSKNTARNTNPRGVFLNVPYEYASGITYRKSNFILRRFYDLWGGLIAGIRIISNGPKPDIVLLVSNDVFHILFYCLLCRIRKIGYYQEKSEIPFHQMKINLLQKFYIRYIYKCFDGIIVISDYLKTYFSDKIRKNARLLQIPILIDFHEFNPDYRISPEHIYTIVYAGALDQKKDGILSIINAFGVFVSGFPHSRLIIMGDTKQQGNKDKILELIQHHSIQEKVEFTGYVSREAMIKNYMNASLLVLAKPRLNQNEYNFPTKVGEYLASGNPVLITRVGILTQYLQDNVNAFFVESDDPQDLAKAFENVHSHPELAMNVGMNGKILAEKEFHYTNQVAKLARFFLNQE